mmetsp:Transcript_5376/g.16225  ORF Transcript_5376/g.16225 Transcript_5376/m.16225 type:complete len:224 (-) Transcript_5376:48-719(-)
MAAAAWSLPVTFVSSPPGQTPKIVPTEKLVSTIEEPSRGSKATEKPSPPIWSGSGTSSLQASSQHPENLRVSNKILSASKSTASCSSPKEFTQAVAPQLAVRTLNAIVLMASPMLSIKVLSFLSSVLFSRNSSRVSPTSALAACALIALLAAPLLAFETSTPLNPHLTDPNNAFFWEDLEAPDLLQVVVVAAVAPVDATTLRPALTLFAPIISGLTQFLCSLH